MILLTHFKYSEQKYGGGGGKCHTHCGSNPELDNSSSKDRSQPLMLLQLPEVTEKDTACPVSAVVPAPAPWHHRGT